MTEKIAYALEPTDALSTEALEQLKGETKKDEALQLLQDTQKHGWPRYRKQTDSHLRQYWPIRHTFAVRGSDDHRRQDNPTKHNKNQSYI